MVNITTQNTQKLTILIRKFPKFSGEGAHPLPTPLGAYGASPPQRLDPPGKSCQFLPWRQHVI